MMPSMARAEGSEWGHLIIQAKRLQPVMWEELNYSIMHHTLRRRRRKKKEEFVTTGSTRLSVEVFASLAVLGARCQNEVSQMFLDSVCSLRSRVISFLTLCPWPAASSGFWFTMNTADGRVRQRGRGWRGWERQPLTHNIVPTAK